MRVGSKNMQIYKGTVGFKLLGSCYDHHSSRRQVLYSCLAQFVVIE